VDFIRVMEPRAKPAAAKVRAHVMSRSRRHVLVWCLVIASITAGVAYRFFLLTSERAQVGQNSAAPKKARASAQGGPVVPVITQVVTVEDFPIRRRTIGILESPATVIIRSRIDSQVLAQHVSDGEIVNKDALLFTLDDREIKATIARDQATITKDQAALTQTEAALRRTQELISKNVAPQQQLEQATAAFKAAQQSGAAGRPVAFGLRPNLRRPSPAALAPSASHPAIWRQMIRPDW
jgi:membrane fusion protein, multidrug efflux system